MFEKESIPFAPTLIESMRSIGYSFHTAIADLIDNSISANAKVIEISMVLDPKPLIMILDDGHGMNKIELEEAMRYGSKNPTEKREENDLGRFGLGLKSASLSQCRKLTVISKKDNKISAFIWDIDYVIQKRKWSLLELTSKEIDKLYHSQLLKNKVSGTLVILENFDRIEKTTRNLENTFNDKLNNTIDHLSLVFHRFIDDGIEIKINNTSIAPINPFLTNHKATITRREQVFYIDNTPIKVKPYILPHITKLSNEDLRIVGGKDSLRNDQGFYIYRNKRLIIWGTWFRLERKNELNKLARVMVDIPNTLDYVWSIDIKKSTARLPDIIKKNLYNAVYETVSKSENIHRYRGRKENKKDELNYIWERVKTRTGFSYKVNRCIPQLSLLKKSLDVDSYKQIEYMLKLLEDSVPATTMYLDVSKGHYDNSVSNQTTEMFKEIKYQVEQAKKLEMDAKSLLTAFICTEPYCNDENLKELIREEIESYG